MGDLFHWVIRSILARLMATAIAFGGVCSELVAQGQLANFETKAPFTILMDPRSGKVYFEKNADALMAPASMSKIMTMIMVFEGLKAGRLHFNDEFTISENCLAARRWRVGRVDNVCGIELESAS